MPEPETYAHIGQVVRALRVKRGWTQADLAGKFGVVGPYISMLETGKEGYTNPQLDTLERYATAFNLSASDLIAMIDRKVPA